MAGDQEQGEAQLACGHILQGVVAHHHALLGRFAQLAEDILVIGRVGLAEAAVFIGGDQGEVLGGEAHPAQPGLDGYQGEEGIGGQDQGIALVPEAGH